MAVANTKSTLVTNADTLTGKQNDPRLDGARVRTKKAFASVAAADDAASVYRMFRVSSKDKVHSLLLFSSGITSLSDLDTGLYDTAENGGAVVDKDFFGDGTDVSSAQLTGVQVAFQASPGAAEFSIDKIEMPLWQALGLTSDPNKDYDVCLTSNSDPAGAGTLALVMAYT